MGYHAKRSPSSAKVWTDCTASIDAQEGLSDTGSEAARLGTCQHQLSAECLEHGNEPQDYLGRAMGFYYHQGAQHHGEDWADLLNKNDDLLDIEHTIVVTQEMVDASASYIDFVNKVASSQGATMYVEQQVPIAHITGEARDGTPLAKFPHKEPACGTADVILTTDDTLTTIDAKFGRGKVNAYDVIKPAGTDPFTGEHTPEVLRMNLQLAMYLLGSLEKYGMFGDFKHVKAIIVQPYLNHVSEYGCPIEELVALGEWIKARAESGRTKPIFSPSFSNCHFCRARFTCKAREEVVMETCLVGFDDIDEAQPRPIRINQLGSIYDRLEMIADWCKDVHAKVLEELQAGRPVVRNDGIAYKLVAGRLGHRVWRDPEAAEAMLKQMRMREDRMYKRTLATPAQLEELAVSKKPKKGQPAVAPVIGPNQWDRIQTLIFQAPGAPSIALETDPRPAIASAVDGFEDQPAEPAESCADLF